MGVGFIGDSMKIQTFQDAEFNDPTVHRAISAGATTEQLVVMLCNEKQDLLARIMDLELIAPRKIRVGDLTFVYRCPDHLIP